MKRAVLHKTHYVELLLVVDNDRVRFSFPNGLCLPAMRESNENLKDVFLCVLLPLVQLHEPKPDRRERGDGPAR